MQQLRNFLLFLALAILFWFGWNNLRQRLWPPPPPDEGAFARQHTRPILRGATALLLSSGHGPAPLTAAAVLATEKTVATSTAKPAKEGPKPPAASPLTPTDKTALTAILLGSGQGPAPLTAAALLAPEKAPTRGAMPVLGSDDPQSPYHLRVVLDPLGGGVHSVLLNKFQASTEAGEPAWEDPQTKRVRKLLELIPADANHGMPSFVLYHYDPNDPNDDRPIDTLGRRVWRTVKEKGQALTETKDAQGRVTQRVSFRTEIAGVQITKTYTLTEGTYHLGMEVRLRRVPGAKKEVTFRYQLTGAHGLPVEGKWYTGTFRNAVIAQERDHGVIDRDLQELQRISHMEGGNEVNRQEGRILRYAGVLVQFFASVLVVDNEQTKQDFLRKARPTLETGLVKGTVKEVARDFSRFVVTTDDKPQKDVIFHVHGVEQVLFRAKGLAADAHVAVVYHDAPYDEALKECPRVATRIALGGAAERTHALWEDDITVRVATEPAEVKPGAEVVHKYLLYNGPVKVALLGQLSGESQVSQELVDRYVDKLHLNTLTDYQSNGPMGTFSSTIYWTALLIKCTNLMHWVLGHLHDVVPNYGICIILLTVLVRGLMFPVSRKQAMTTMKMQELAPELKKLQAKHKDDRQAMAAAQMELYRRHGVNPFATCWFLLLQMPIFMGLYFALQESFHFRLAPFWPTWVHNLAAPDMLWNWGQSVPWINRPESYGGFLYLGPYFNLLPVVAVVLMLITTKMMTPPPQDEQQVMQQKMMKYMMIFFGLMFYKVAAGLCLYFIASSVWGVAERKLLPKKKPAGAAGTAADTGAPRPAGPAPSTAITTGPAAGSTSITAGRGRNRPGRNRRRPERGIRADGPTTEEATTTGLGAWWRERRRRLREWWQEVLRQAKKK